MKLKSGVYLIGMLFLGVVMGLSIKMASAWVDPVDSQNIFAPLNTSSVGQSKLGGLVLNLGNATYGLIVRYGFVGIGTDKPTVALEVAGDIKGNNLDNADKIRTNQLCFTKQGTIEDCRSEWPKIGAETYWEYNTNTDYWGTWGAYDLVAIRPDGSRTFLNEDCLCNYNGYLSYVLARSERLYSCTWGYTSKGGGAPGLDKNYSCAESCSSYQMGLEPALCHRTHTMPPSVLNY